jgi:asparagine synthase (glutamine-hydrolysing)
MYRGMAELRPGCLLRVRRTGASARQYWRLAALEHPDDCETTVSRVRGDARGS